MFIRRDLLDSSVFPRKVRYFESGLDPKLSRFVTAGSRASSNKPWQPRSLNEEDQMSKSKEDFISLTELEVCP